MNMVASYLILFAMHNIVLKTAEIDKKELYKRNAMESDAEMEITEDTIAFDEN